MAQLVARILGKDEVGGSSPLGSLEGIQIGCLLFLSFFVVCVEKSNKMWYTNKQL